MRKRQAMGCFLAVFLAFAGLRTASASIVVIDFNGLSDTSNPSSPTTPLNIGPSYTEDGFVVSVPGTQFLSVVVDGRADYTGTPAVLANIVTTTTITVAAIGSQPFDAISIDLAKLDIFSSNFDPTIEFTGHLQGSGITTQSFIIMDPDNFSSGNTPTTFTFDSTFKNLTSLTWDNTAVNQALHQFDNITLDFTAGTTPDTVPEPTGALVAGILLCLAGACRPFRRSGRRV